jgi:hypothetical protein
MPSAELGCRRIHSGAAYGDVAVRLTLSKLEADMIWKPSPKAIQAAAEAYISDKGIKAVLEAAINVDRPIVDLSAIRTGRLRQPAIAEQSRFMKGPPGGVPSGPTNKEPRFGSGRGLEFRR